MIVSESKQEKASLSDDGRVNVLTERILADVIEHMECLLNSLLADDTDAAMKEEQFVAKSLRAIYVDDLPREQLIVFWNEYLSIHDKIVITAKRTQADIRQSLQNKNIAGKKIYAYQKMGSYGA